MATSVDRIASVIHSRFPDNEWASTYYGDLLSGYEKSGSSPPHLLAELETLDVGKFWSCVWEAMLYDHIRASGYELRGVKKQSGQDGPDLCFERDGRLVWIEAVVPAPDGIPDEWLTPIIPGEVRVRSKPDVERVLRCTSAIVDKRKKFDNYLAKRIVSENDICVIAVNICRLSDWDIDGMGISQLPLCVEALFPIGAIGVPLNSRGEQAGLAQNMFRPSVQKGRRVDVETSNFLDKDFRNISAVAQWHRKDAENGLSLTVVHNPLALHALPMSLLKGSVDYKAEVDSDRLSLVRFPIDSSA